MNLPGKGELSQGLDSRKMGFQSKWKGRAQIELALPTCYEAILGGVSVDPT